MQERPENFNDDDPEGTLVTPRFDAEEARQAHPVVPLAEAPPHAPSLNTRGRAGRGLQRSWPPALIAVALLAAAAIGGVIATKVVRGPQPAPAAVQAPAAVAPPQTAEAEPVRQTPPVAETPRETTGTKPEPRAPRVRRVEDAGARAEAARADAEDFKDEHEDRRGKGRGKRRARGEDDGEKEMRRVLKDAKKKAPRLVDVLVNP